MKLIACKLLFVENIYVSLCFIPFSLSPQFPHLAFVVHAFVQTAIYLKHLCFLCVQIICFDLRMLWQAWFHGQPVKNQQRNVKPKRTFQFYKFYTSVKKRLCAKHQKQCCIARFFILLFSNFYLIIYNILMLQFWWWCFVYALVYCIVLIDINKILF